MEIESRNDTTHFLRSLIFILYLIHSGCKTKAEYHTARYHHYYIFYKQMCIICAPSLGWACVFAFVVVGCLLQFKLNLYICMESPSIGCYQRFPSLAIITKPINYFGKFKFNSTKMWAIKTRDIQSRDAVKIGLFCGSTPTDLYYFLGQILSLKYLSLWFLSSGERFFLLLWWNRLFLSCVTKINSKVESVIRSNLHLNQLKYQ